MFTKSESHETASSEIDRTFLKNEKIIVFFPAFNETGKIGRAVSKVPRKYVHEILVWDDASTDSTREEALTAGATVMSNKSREGVGSIMRKSINYAREKGYTILVEIAGNDKDKPDEMDRLLSPVINEGFNMVQGSRYLPGGEYGNMPIYRILGTKFIHPFLMSIILRRRLTDTTNGFRAIRLSVFDDKRINLNQQWLDKYELEPYIIYKLVKLGYKYKEVPVTKIYPTKKTTKMQPLIGWWSIMKPIFVLALGLRR